MTPLPVPAGENRKGRSRFFRRLEPILDWQLCFGPTVLRGVSARHATPDSVVSVEPCSPPFANSF
jgi:hypothetical protein